MKKFLTYVVLFLVFALAAYLILLIFLGNALPPRFLKNFYYPVEENAQLKFSDLKTAKNIDLLFLGSSHAEHGFDVRIFDSLLQIHPFNIGTSGQTPLQTELLLNRYLDRLNPKTIIFEVYPEAFAIDGTEGGILLISNDRNDKYSIKMALKTNNMKMYNTLIYALFRNFFTKNKNTDDSKWVPKNGKYVEGGFIEKEVAYFKAEHYDTTSWGRFEKQYESFERILQEIQKRNIQLYLVQAPITTAYYNAHTNNDAFDAYMQKKGMYLNFNEILPLNDSLYFYDNNHLNQNGVEIFNLKLIEILSGDPAFKNCVR